MTTDYRRWLALGTGVGIEIGPGELQVSIVRVRPSGITVLGSARVTEFRERPAAEWGTELAGFLRKLGCGHIAANVLLPRRDVIVRQISLPGVSDRDLEAAVRLQVDSLHPFAEDDVRYSWSRLGKTGAVLVGITRKEVVDRYATLFAEAGIKVAAFTFSAAAIYSAIRILSEPPAESFAALHEANGEQEVYGESDSRPVFSINFDRPSEQSVTRALSELRLPPETVPVPLEDLLPKPSVYPANHDPGGEGFGQHALPYATALAGACPLLALQANLLPAEQRRSSSRMRLVPTFALAGLLVIMVGALAAHSTYENGRYLRALQAEIGELEPQARRSQSLDRELTRTRARTQALDDFRRRSKADMDVLQELNRLLPPPAWLNSLEVNRTGVQIGGEAEQAAGLLKVLDESPLFDGSEFSMAPVKMGIGESFRIRTRREGAK